MKIAVISLLLTSVFSAWFDGPKCTFQIASYFLADTDKTWIDYDGSPNDLQIGCWDDAYSCGSSKFEGSFTKQWKAWFTDNVYEETYTYSTESKRCVADTTCDKLAGDEDSCQYASYTYNKWRPRSCNETADFNAITEAHNLNLYFSCCNDPDYCNKDVSYDSCNKSEPFTNYMTALNVCWNDYKYDFMKDLLCDDERGDILNFTDNCANTDGSWKPLKRTDPDCKYKVTCSQELKDKLTELAGCACTAAADNGYTGEFIGTALAVNWNTWCPGVTIECANNGIAKLLYKYYYARYKFRVAVARAVITDAIITKIKEKIAERLNVDPGRITITETTTSRRRLLEDSTEMHIDINSDDSLTKSWLQSQLNSLQSDINSDISSELNGTTIDETAVSSGEAEDEQDATYQGSIGNPTTTKQGNTENKNHANKYMVYGAFIAVIFAFIN